MGRGLKIALITGGIILALAVIASWAIDLFGNRNGYDYQWGMMGPWTTGGFGVMGLMGIFWVVVLGLIIWAVAAAARGTHYVGGEHMMNQSESASEILKKRYARGEITKAQYDEMKKDLM